MILGDENRAMDGERSTLDDLFRRAGVRHADALALVDPDNRETFTGGAPRRLSYAQADRAISALAAQLRRIGLQTDAVVAMQLPHTVESVIALLGVLRAGMIAVPLPLLWRKQEIVAALPRVGAKAIVTAARIGGGAQSTCFAEIAMQAAAEVFSIRHVCAFGRDLPDGVVPLDPCMAPDQADFLAPSARPGNAAAHVAVVTFDIGQDGLVAVARNHSELIAGGRGPYLESGGALDAKILSTIPPGSFAGMALGLLPWLLGGGTLTLHHGFDPGTFAAQCHALDGGCVVVPGPALAGLSEAGQLAVTGSIIALWRSPERLTAGAPWQGAQALVDVASFGEVGLIAGRRGTDGLAVAIPNGSIGAPRGAVGAVSLIEAMRSAAGTLALRGAMVPVQSFPPGAERGRDPHLSADGLGFVDTGFACSLDRVSQTLVINAPAGGITGIGGYRFRQSAVDGLVATADPDAVIVALPDALLGQRLAGSAPNDAVTAQDLAQDLAARGVNPLIAGAFRPRRSIAA